MKGNQVYGFHVFWNRKAVGDLSRMMFLKKGDHCPCSSAAKNVAATYWDCDPSLLEVDDTYLGADYDE